jgi:acyl-[acyl-carrier-protein]-phospholipid O-acyltransferase/long-chain-fatty-acid--[acyl-carrier-protein] ligase
MAGYLIHGREQQLQTLQDGWYPTGDIVRIDDEDYLFILDRIKRFAKIAGEMVSLSAVEERLEQCFPHSKHAVIAMPDDRRGERIVWICTDPDAQLDVIQKWYRTYNYPEISLPKQVIHVTQIPLLGSGKVNYLLLKQQLST